MLVDHLVAGSKESRIAAQVAKLPGGSNVLVTGHPYVDVWQAVKPGLFGLSAWPNVPRGTDIKHGTLAAFRLASRHPGRYCPRLAAYFGPR